MKILILLLSLVSTVLTQELNKFCVDPDFHVRCEELSRDTNIQCVKVEDRVDCALRIQRNEADFGVFDAESVHIITGFTKNDNAVIGELWPDKIKRDHAFQMVVVVRSSFTGNLNDLKGKKYCHPGFAGHPAWTPRLLKEFENNILRDKFANSCNSSDKNTYVERELKILSDFFGDSCRPGPWTNDQDLDAKLRKKYSKLCKLCDNPVECTQNSDTSDSLKCLTEKNGDIAFTSLSNANEMANKHEYRLICKNGEFQEITSEIKADCSWRNQPHKLLIGQVHKADALKRSIKYWLPREAQVDISDTSSHVAPGYVTFGQMVTNNNQYYFKIVNVTSALPYYLATKNQKINLQSNPYCEMKWCTISDQEQEKCKWLARTALYAGISPEIACIPGNNIYDCLKKIKENNADIMAIDSNYGYLARIVGINNVVYNQISATDTASIIAVAPPGSSLNTFSDFSKKRACFPEYRGLAWVAFIENARRKKLIPNSCDFGKSVSNFFDAACAPGANDEQHSRSANTNYPKLCSACSGNCDSNNQNSYYDNHGSLNCLVTKIADVAFVEREAIANDTKFNNYKVICNEGPSTTLGIVDENESCYMSQTIDSELISRNNDSRKASYRDALLSMDKLFGITFIVDKPMNIFKRFGGVPNLLVKSNVLGFEDDSSSNKYVQNYVKLFKAVDECTAGAKTMAASGFIILFMYNIVTFFTRNISV